MAAKKQLMKKPSAPKVNKNAKPSEVEPRIDNDEEYRCTCCGHKYKKQETNFGSSKSPLFKGNNGYLSICRHCIATLYDQYIPFYDNDEDAAMERICQITDMYFDPDIWAMSRKISTSKDGRSRNRVSTYISKLNLKQSDGCNTYSDTLIRRWEAEVENAETVQEAAKNDDIAVSVETMRRFGMGFSDGDYDVMQSEYDSWIEKMGEPMDKRQEELYVTMCYMKLNFQKSIQAGSAGIGALANAYKAFIEAATTEIEDRKKKAEAEMELKPIGMLFRDIEEYCPAEYYKDKKLYADFDHLKEYISRFMARPLVNLLTGSKEMDKEFNLSGSEE